MDRRKSIKLGASIVAGMAVAPGISACKSTTEVRAMESFWDVVKHRPFICPCIYCGFKR